MPDNTDQESMDHIKETTEQNINHIVRHSPDTKGIINIEAKTNGEFNVTLHDGTQNRPRTIESISKDKLLKMMEEQL